MMGQSTHDAGGAVLRLHPEVHLDRRSRLALDRCRHVGHSGRTARGSLRIARQKFCLARPQDISSEMSLSSDTLSSYLVEKG